MLESQNQPMKAYTALQGAYKQFGTDPLRPGVVLSPSAWASRNGGTSTEVPGARSADSAGGYVLDERDHIRAIGLAQKLGHLAVQFASMRPLSALPLPSSTALPPPKAPNWDSIAEQHLSAVLACMLGLGLPTTAGTSQTASTGGQVVLGRDLHLPSDPQDGNSAEQDVNTGIGRVDKRGVAMTMEALSEVYARQGRHDLANQLLLQTVSVLLPVGAERAPPLQDQCQGE